MKIDVVIPWVDGNDPVLKAKKASYGDAKALSRADVGGETRYSNLGEIHWCIASINRFDPFVNRIFIVTDGQDPGVESRIPVEIVDHKVIFSGHEDCLPVFNSYSIETLIWNIPSMSEHFLLMNDDFVLTAPVSPADFFGPGGEVFCYGRRKSSLWASFVYWLSVLKYGYARSTFKKSLIIGSRMGGSRRNFFYLVHTPRPLLKSVFREYFEKNPEAVTSNIRNRFRNPAHFQSQALEYALLDGRKQLKLVDSSDKLLFLQHWKGADYVSGKISRAAAKHTLRFACFNSLDEASPEERAVVAEWIEKLLKEV